MQEMRNAFEDLSDKTFSRDIALLKRAGVPIQFSGKRKAYVLRDEAGNESSKAPRRKPDYPEGRKERQYIEKIVRLTTMMDEMAFEDCDVWYRATFPNASKRTMQRDFAALNEIGYRIFYKRAWEEPWNKEDEDPPGRYYYDEVCNPLV